MKIKASSNLIQFFGKGLKESQRSSMSDEIEGYLSIPFRERHKLTGHSSFNSKAINLVVMLSSPFLAQYQLPSMTKIELISTPALTSQPHPRRNMRKSM